MSKKFLAGIILIIVVAFIGLFTSIRAIKNFVIIEKIFDEVMVNIQKENYYLRTTMNYDGKTSITKTYYKKGIGKLVSDNGIYTWADGEKAYMVDEVNKTVYNLDLNNSLGLVSNEMFASLIPGYSKSAFEKFLMFAQFRNSIRSEKIDNKKCYKVKVTEENCIKTYWIEKNSKKTIKATIEFLDGNIYEYNYELQFNVTKNIDVELPDIAEYKIKEMGNDVENLNSDILDVQEPEVQIENSNSEIVE